MSLPGDAWMDDDGKHVWWRHKCSDGLEHDYMLPWPMWQAKDGLMHPSVVCNVKGCNHHSQPRIGKKP